MITIKIKGTEVRLENEEWACEDKELKAMLDTYNYESLEFYAPFPDLALAELVIKEMGGKIIKITNKPKFIKGRIY